MYFKHYTTFPYFLISAPKQTIYHLKFWVHRMRLYGIADIIGDFIQKHLLGKKNPCRKRGKSRQYQYHSIGEADF